LDLLQFECIDHGVRSEEVPQLMQRLIDEGIPLTVCPLFNLRLRVVDNLADHTLARMLRRGAVITINSDDPAYFGGYIGDNYMACANQLGLQRQELRTLAANSIKAAFLADDVKQHWLQKLNSIQPA